MQEKIYEEMMSYLANATKEQLAEDFKEILNNQVGPMAIDYIESVLQFTTEDMYISEKNFMQTCQTNLTDDFSFSGYCLAA